MGQANADAKSFIIFVIQLDISGNVGPQNMQPGIIGPPLFIGETVEQHC